MKNYDNFDVDEFVVGINEADKQRVVEFGQRLKAGAIKGLYFCTAAIDLSLLHRFTHMADVFVFCDPTKSKAEIALEFEKLTQGQTAVTDRLTPPPDLININVNAAFEVMTDKVINLAHRCTVAFAHVADAVVQEQPWGRLMRLHRLVGNDKREIWVVFVSGCPVRAYKAIFKESRGAPVFLDLRFPSGARPAVGIAQPLVGEDFAENWRTQLGFGGALGGFIMQHRMPLPSLVADDIYLGWPHLPPLYHIPGRNELFRRTYYGTKAWAWPELRPDSEAAHRRVTVTRAPLDPLSAKKVDAVVIGIEKFDNYVWPDGVCAILNGDAVDADAGIVNGPRGAIIDVRGLPLLVALERLEELCRQRGFKRVAIDGLPGFEDEAEDLRLWRHQSGQIQEVTFHFDCDGHLIDYASAADFIK